MARPHGIALVWFRQDLRIQDNPALHEAARSAARVLPVYVLDDESEGAWAMGGASRWWLHHSLASLGRDLAALGAPLLLRRGRSADIIPALAGEVGVDAVHAGVAHEPFWRDIDADVGERLRAEGRGFALHRGATLFDPDAVRTQTGGIYGMFGPFANAALAGPPPAQPLAGPKSLHGADAPAGEALDDWGLLPMRPDWAGGLRATWTVGERAASARMQRFLSGAVGRYATARDVPGEDGTSMLSPHLHFGELSPRTVWHASLRAAEGEQGRKFRAELLWRDLAAYLLWHHRNLPEEPLRPAFAALAWRRDPAALRAWQRGMTGVPIVDAGMRQLWQTGWMHNRVRMITASFLIKHLLISWQEGERWFWDTLVDADLASNAAGWQWVAGTGIDSQPFFRVFNPVTQGEKFDASGAYVRRFVPELAGLPDRYLHQPWEAPPMELLAAGVTLGKTYPHPLIDLAEGRRRALDVYQATVRDAGARA
jgi:deoxyribodipyrimidine photo-lyase